MKGTAPPATVKPDSQTHSVNVEDQKDIKECSSRSSLQASVAAGFCIAADKDNTIVERFVAITFLN